MFDRFDESARHVIFFARHEATTFGSGSIETYHLLLGILRTDGQVRSRVLGRVTVDELRSEFLALDEHKAIPISVDMRLSAGSRRALELAAEEAELANDRTIRPAHLLAGLLQEAGPAFDALQRRGFDLARVRTEFCGAPDVGRQTILERILGEMPADRMAAAERILEALAAPEVSIQVTKPDGQFTVSFPGDGEDR